MPGLDIQLGWFRSVGMSLRDNLDFKVKMRNGVTMVSKSLSLYKEGVGVGCLLSIRKVCIINACMCLTR